MSSTMTAEQLPLQRSPLRVSQPDDPLEKEAEEVADRVMRMPSPEVGLIQRCAGGCPDDEMLRRQPVDEEEEEEELIQRCPGGVPDEEMLRRQVDEEDEDVVQRCPGGCPDEEMIRRQPVDEEEEEEFLAQRSSKSREDTATPAEVSSAIQARQGAGNPLPLSTRRFFEPRLGGDFSKVRVHHDSEAAHLAASVNARAFTIGRAITFGPGEFAPNSDAGRRLIAHELAHVVQQDLGVTSQLQRQTVESCDDSSADAFRSAHRDAATWIEYALRQLGNPRSISSLLQEHFRLGPSDPGIATVRSKLEQVLATFTGNANTLRCEPDATCRTVLGADSNGNPIYRGGYVPTLGDDDIVFCQHMFDGDHENRVRLLVHEAAHTAPNIDDGPYRRQRDYPGTTPLANAEAYSEFVRDVWLANRFILSAPLGYLLGGSEARFAFGVTATGILARRWFWGLDLTLGGTFLIAPDTGELVYAGRLGLQREITTSITLDVSALGGFGQFESRGALQPAAVGGAGLGLRWNVWDDLNVGVSFDYLRTTLSREPDPSRYILSGNVSWTF